MSMSGDDVIVRLERVHARDASLPRGRAKGRVEDVTRTFATGLHLVVGAPEDGTLALADVLVGASRPRSGRVLVDGLDPATQASARRRIASALAPTHLLPAHAVAESLALACRALGTTTEACLDMLRALSLEGLVSRRVDSLTYGETRAVELALALSAEAPRLVVVHEPLTDIATAQTSVVRERLHALASGGACVVVFTSSSLDAASIGGRVHPLVKGRLVEQPVQRAHWASFVVWIRERGGGRTLAQALGKADGVSGVAWSETEPGGGVVRLFGDRAACALAVADAVTSSGVVIDGVREEPASFDGFSTSLQGGVTSPVRFRDVGAEGRR